MISQTRKLYEFCVYVNDDLSRILKALTYPEISFKNRARVLRLTSQTLYQIDNSQVVDLMHAINDNTKALMV